MSGIKIGFPIGVIICSEASLDISLIEIYVASVKIYLNFCRSRRKTRGSCLNVRTTRIEGCGKREKKKEKNRKAAFSVSINLLINSRRVDCGRRNAKYKALVSLLLSLQLTIVITRSIVRQMGKRLGV